MVTGRKTKTSNSELILMNTNQIARPLDLMRDPKITKFELNDFIAVWENFVPEAFCNNLIELFENVVNKTGDYINPEGLNSSSKKRIENIISKGDIDYNGNTNRKDISILLNYIDDEYSLQVNRYLNSCVLHYIDNFSQLKSFPMFSVDIKFQKTSPEGGYHLWHYENSHLESSNRELVWMIYLNDVPDGEGETEFLYQRRRIKPTKGTVVIFPAGMTHVHKGNTIFTTDKYILTGWYIKTSFGT